VKEFNPGTNRTIGHKIAGQRGIPALIILAFLCRFLFCVWLFPNFFIRYASVGDQYFFDTYREIAIQLLAGNGYRLSAQAAPILNRPPGYTIALALTMPQLTQSPMPLHILNSILGAIAVFATYLLARSCNLSSKLSMFASAIVAFWPFLIWESKVSVPENLLVALFPLFLLALLRAIREDSIPWTCAAAVLAACLALTHGLYQFLLPLGTLAMIIGKRRLWHVVCYLCLSTVLIAPWAIRNYRLAGYNVGVATGFGYHYFKGLYTYGQLIQGDYFRDFDAEGDAYVRAVAGISMDNDTAFRSDPTVNRKLDTQAKEDMLQHPVFFLARGLVRLPLIWVQQQNKVRSLITALFLLPLVLISFIGFFGDGAFNGQRVLSMILLAMNFVFAAIFAEAMPMRYALPWMPLLSVLSARGILPLISYFRTKELLKS
jgi:hypothetical protein